MIWANYLKLRADWLILVIHFHIFTSFHFHINIFSLEKNFGFLNAFSENCAIIYFHEYTNNKRRTIHCVNY